MFRLQMTVKESDTHIIFDLLHGVAKDFRMVEVNPDYHPHTNGATPPAAATGVKQTNPKWALRMWPQIEPVFKQAKATGTGILAYDDPRLIAILVNAGNSASTITPLLSELRRCGKLVRPHRGMYKLP